MSSFCINHLKEVFHTFALRYFIRKKFPKGHLGKNCHIHTPSMISVGSLKNIFLGDNVNIDWDNVLYVTEGRLIMKDNSGAAFGLTVIANSHIVPIGERLKDGNSNLIGKDIIVEEDVWIAANVTILAGTIVGRGAIVGAGSVLLGKKVPPYAVVMGNPAKVVGYRYTPEEILEHEKYLYPEDKRLSFDILQRNYEKYYLNRIREIKEWTRL